MVLNVNAVTIAQSLSTNATQRALIIEAAQRIDALATAAAAPEAPSVPEATSEPQPETPRATEPATSTETPAEPQSETGAGTEAPAKNDGAAIIANEFRDQLNDIELPIGWSSEQIERQLAEIRGSENWFEAVGVVLTLVLGYVITGLAATLGAPFWFDVLNKFMVIRSTVKPAEKSGDEGSEDRKTGRPVAGEFRGSAGAGASAGSDLTVGGADGGDPFDPAAAARGFSGPLPDRKAVGDDHVYG